ncbi:MAG: hypothetical protein LBB18_02015 [Puniceicoccales bacterium]|nr:hypothetical protein [Puniceicoccales bacterium]
MRSKSTAKPSVSGHSPKSATESGGTPSSGEVSVDEPTDQHPFKIEFSDGSYAIVKKVPNDFVKYFEFDSDDEEPEIKFKPQSGGGKISKREIKFGCDMAINRLKLDGQSASLFRSKYTEARQNGENHTHSELLAEASVMANKAGKKGVQHTRDYEKMYNSLRLNGRDLKFSDDFATAYACVLHETDDDEYARACATIYSVRSVGDRTKSGLKSDLGVMLSAFSEARKLRPGPQNATWHRAYAMSYSGEIFEDSDSKVDSAPSSRAPSSVCEQARIFSNVFADMYTTTHNAVKSREYANVYTSRLRVNGTIYSPNLCAKIAKFSAMIFITCRSFGLDITAATECADRGTRALTGDTGSGAIQLCDEDEKFITIVAHVMGSMLMEFPVDHAPAGVPNDGSLLRSSMIVCDVACACGEREKENFHSKIFASLETPYDNEENRYPVASIVAKLFASCLKIGMDWDEAEELACVFIYGCFR